MLKAPRRQAFAPRAESQAGMSIVELMVGVAIGLVIVAAASLLMTSQLIENRKLLTETQLQQDLRAAADIMTRELRRIGSRPEAPALTLLWSPGSSGAIGNAMARRLTVGTSMVDFEYEPGLTSATTFGYRLAGGVIETNMGSSSGWQQLTDGKVMVVDSLNFSLRNAGTTPIRLPCTRACLDGTSSCWPTFEVREIDVVITAHAVRDSNIKRTVRSSVRLRNDRVLFSDDPAGLQACPA